MLEPHVEEALEKLFIHLVEEGPSPSDPRTLQALEEARGLDLVYLEDGGYRLTESGRAAGRDVVRRHRLAERLLNDVLAVSKEDLEGDACEFEHIIQPGLEKRICILLGHPSTCPHGKAIPPGDCCRAAREDRIPEVSPLCDGRPGAEGVVAYLSTRDNREIQKMMAMGILPGTKVALLQTFPSYVLQVAYSQFTFDRSLAEMIYIHWHPPTEDLDPGSAREGAPRRRRWRWRWRRPRG